VVLVAVAVQLTSASGAECSLHSRSSIVAHRIAVVQPIVDLVAHRIVVVIV
jgi:hypothetical protein